MSMNIALKKKFRKILLVKLNSSVIESVGFPRACRPPFLLKYAEAILTAKAGYEVKLIDCLICPQKIDALIASTIKWSPDVLVISGTTIDSSLFQQYPRMVKERIDALVIGVGQGITAIPTEYLSLDSAVDLTLPGEAEEELVGLIEMLNTDGSIKKVLDNYRAKAEGPFLVEDLNRLPFPAYDIKELKRYRFIYPIAKAKKLVWGHILSSRGCPYSCIFCSQMTRESYGAKVRLRSAVNIVDEIECLTARGANIISFDDDNFTTVREHVLAICEEIRRRHLKIDWITHARVDNMSAELLRAMKQAGCVLIRFGIESGSQRIVDILGKTKYKDWVSLCEGVFSKARENKIPTAALFQIGCPSETEKEIWQSIELAKKLKPDIIQVSYFIPYPGSSAYLEIKDKINQSVFSQMYHYNAPPVNFSKLEMEELKSMFKLFYKKFILSPSFIISHFFKYAMFYLYNLDVLFELLKIRKHFQKWTEPLKL